MSFNLFAAPTKDDIKVGYIDPTLGFVNGVSVCEANEYAKNNPGTTFVFRDGDNNIRYLSINEVNLLTPNDLIASEGECAGIQEYRECGPPIIQFFGGGGIGAAGNPIIGRDGSLLAVDLITGGYGYQYPPIVAAKDYCQIGNGAVLTAVLGETADEIEVFEGEEDFEEYQLCKDTDVGYGKRFGPNGEELGPWEPQVYTRVGADPIQREIEIFQRALKNPFWTTRETQPDRVYTIEKSYATQDTVPVTFSQWGEFMNTYAVSPIKPSDLIGSSEAGKIFSMEWELNFPVSGEYIFRGVCDDTAQVFVDGSLVGNLKGFKDNPSPLQKTISEGNHILKVDLLNAPAIEKPTATDTSTSTTTPSNIKAKFIKEGSNFYLQVDGTGSGEINFVMDVDDNPNFAGLAAREVIIPSDGGKVIFKRKGKTGSGVFAGNAIFDVTVPEKETIKENGKFSGGRKYGPIQIVGSGVGARGPIIKSPNRLGIRDADGDDENIKITIGNIKQTVSSTPSTNISQSPAKNGVTYTGPNLFGHVDKRWSKYMNTYSVSPQVSENIGKFTLTWSNVDFPYDGTYKFNLQSDNNALLKVGGREILRTSDFTGEKIQYTFNATQGKYDVVLELENVKTEKGGKDESVFASNPMGVALSISKDVSFDETNKTPWTTNPMGVSAILIPPPCAKKIGGRGVIDRVEVIDTGNGYLPPGEQGPGYPVTLVLDEIKVIDTGINYRCGEDEIKIFPDNGAKFSYTCDSFGRIKDVKVDIPGDPITVNPIITIGPPPGPPPGPSGPPSNFAIPAVPGAPSAPFQEPTGVNASFRPVFRVVRDPILPPEQRDKIIQVTDLVGLKQTGYIDGRAYYGAIYYDEGVPYAGYYKTVGPQTRVYTTLQESISARVTTPASAIQRSGTDITSNDPRLNIPGTIQDTE